MMINCTQSRATSVLLDRLESSLEAGLSRVTAEDDLALVEDNRVRNTTDVESAHVVVHDALGINGDVVGHLVTHALNELLDNALILAGVDTNERDVGILLGKLVNVGNNCDARPTPRGENFEYACTFKHIDGVTLNEGEALDATNRNVAHLRFCRELEKGFDIKRDNKEEFKGI